MTTRMVHTGIGLDWLRKRVQETQNRGGLVEDGQGHALSGSDALAAIDQWIKSGTYITSSCPTPESDGGCPGHPKEA